MFALGLLAWVEQSCERGLDAVHPDESLVEDHGVGDDCAGHAVGLDDIGHAEQSGDAGDHAGPGLGELFENVGGPVDALLESIGGFVDGASGGRRRGG